MNTKSKIDLGSPVALAAREKGQMRLFFAMMIFVVAWIAVLSRMI